MADIQIDSFAGLHDTNSDLSGVPKGSAEIAVNVILAKFNLMEPRPPFEYARDLLPFNAAFGWAGTTQNVVGIYQLSNDYELYVKLGAPLAYNDGTNQGYVNLAENLASGTIFNLTYQDGVYRLPTILDVNSIPYLFTNGNAEAGSIPYEVVTPIAIGGKAPYLREAGVPRPSEMQTADYGTSGGVFAANDIVAYRTLFLYAASNGAFIKGGVSQRREHTFTGANPKCAVTAFWKAGDIREVELGRFFIQFYRSETGTTVPDDELKLVYQKEITADDLALGYVTYIDNTGDAFLGEFIYTASAVSGIVSDKQKPPRAMTYELFKNALFAGCVEESEPEFEFSLVGVNPAGGSVDSALTIPWNNTNFALNVTATIEEGTRLWIGLSNGAVYVYDGTSFTTVSTGLDGTNPVTDFCRFKGFMIAFSSNAAGAKAWYTSSYLTPFAAITYAASATYPAFYSPVVCGDFLYVAAQGTGTGANNSRLFKLSWSLLPGFVLSPPAGGNIFGLSGVMSPTIFTINDNCMAAFPRNVLNTATKQSDLVPAVVVTVGTQTRVWWYDPILDTWSFYASVTTAMTFTKSRILYSQYRKELILYHESSGLGALWVMRGSTLSSVTVPAPVNTTPGSHLGIRNFRELNGAFYISFVAAPTFIAYSYRVAPHQFTNGTFGASNFISYTPAQSAWAAIANGMLIHLIKYHAGHPVASAGFARTDSPFGFLDYIYIAGFKYQGAASEYVNQVAPTFKVDTSVSVAVRIAATAQSLIRIINQVDPNFTATYASNFGDLPGKIKLKGRRGAVPNGIYSSRISAFSPDMSEANPGVSPQNKPLTNVVAFSPLYEYHCFPAKNRLTIGDRADNILVLKANKNTNFVVKEKSVWAIRGDNETNYFVDKIDDTIRCIAPQSVEMVNSVVYFLSNRGVVAVDDRGVEIIGQNYSAFLEKRDVVDYEDAFAFAVEKYGMYVLCIADAEVSGGRIALIYDTGSQKFYSFKLSVNVISGGVIYDPVSQNEKIVFFADSDASGFESGLYLEERVTTGSMFHQNYHDQTIQTVMSLITDTTCRVVVPDAASIPLVGTRIRSTSGPYQWGKVTGVSLFSPLTYNLTFAWDDGNFYTPSSTLYVSFASRYRFAPQYAGSSANVKHWQKVKYNFENLPSAAVVSKFSVERSPAQYPVSSKRYTNTQSNDADSVSSLVPRNAARGVALTVEIEIENFATRWQLNAVSLEVVGGSTK